MMSYLIVVILFCAPLAALFFAKTFFPNAPGTEVVQLLGMTSPFAATFDVPLDVDFSSNEFPDPGNWFAVLNYALFTLALNTGLLIVMSWLFSSRWRVSTSNQ